MDWVVPDRFQYDSPQKERKDKGSSKRFKNTVSDERVSNEAFVKVSQLKG